MKHLIVLIFWMVWAFIVGPEYRQQHWECLLLVFAVTALVPLALQLMGKGQGELYTMLAIAYSFAFFMPQYWYLALPYLLYALWMTFMEMGSLIYQQPDMLAALLRLFGLGYWVTSIIFGVLYLLGERPFDFDPVMISLTAAHFSVAGLVLTALVYRHQTVSKGKLARMLGIYALIGMPLVAAGIVAGKTASGLPVVAEQLAALSFVMFACIYALVQWRMALQIPKNSKHFWLLGLGSLSLLVGMALAGLYALRLAFPIDWVNIPNMKLWHGSIQTFGFAWLSLLGHSRLD